MGNKNFEKKSFRKKNLKKSLGQNDFDKFALFVIPGYERVNHLLVVLTWKLAKSIFTYTHKIASFFVMLVQ